MKIILVFKTHFDIGFTKLAREIVAQYTTQMLPDVIETCRKTADMGKLRYVWTMPSWPLGVMQENKDRRGELDQLIRDGQIAFHALPFTSHTDFCGLIDTIEGLSCASELADEYQLPKPVSAKMTDVPGHGRILPEILAGAGIRFLHLGCNAYATPPQVPPLFFWEGPDGSRVLTMYSKGGYGSSMTPPEDWPFPVWMALMHTEDNCGPQSAAYIRELVAEAHAAMPDAEIVCGTMDDFYRELEKCDLSAVPIVTADLADSWIHGVGSYPAEVSAVRQTRRDLVTAGTALFAAGGDKAAFEKGYREAVQALSLFGEHTWGLDVKTWMSPERVYRKNKFCAARGSAEYKRMEESWQEQRERAETARSAAEAALHCAAAGEGAFWNANGLPFSGWVNAPGMSGAVSLCGQEKVYLENVPPLSAVICPAEKKYAKSSALENHRYRLTVDRDRGIITKLYDKKLGCALAEERHGVGVFSYQYDVYGIEEMTEYLRNYAYRFFDWGIRDNGKDNYPEVPHRTFRSVCEKITEDGHTLTLHYRSDAVKEYGDAHRIRVSVALPPEGEELFVRLELDEKEATPYVESGSLCIPLAADAPRYRFNKNGNIIDPASDIAAAANHALYCLESFACAEEDGGGLCVVPKDTPLCAIGEPGIYAYRKTYEPHEPILYFNLFNNMWGTNFPQWIDGDLSFSYELFGYRGSCGTQVMNRALTLERGMSYLPTPPSVPRLILPENMQTVLLRLIGDKWLLILRDTGLKERQAVLRAPERNIAPADLRGDMTGRFEPQELAFSVKPFGIYGFCLSSR